MVRVRRSDLERACQVFVEAFREDPFFAYVMGDDDYDRSRVASLHAFTLRYGLAYGSVHASSGRIEAVAAWLPPGATRMSAWRSLRAGVLSAGRTLRAGRAAVRRLMAYGGYAAGIHARVAPFPHWYLLAMGVADAYRGKGFASRLMRPMLASFDVEGLPCYLETHNPANTALYEHFGFHVAYEGRLPGSDRPHWAMLRKGRA
jgi:ribosomal protein S18 acetylase RimI-like enzyme